MRRLVCLVVLVLLVAFEAPAGLKNARQNLSTTLPIAEIEQTVVVGWSAESVRLAAGEPDTVRRYETTSGTFESWEYASGSERLFIALRDGRVESIERLQRPSADAPGDITPPGPLLTRRAAAELQRKVKEGSAAAFVREFAGVPHESRTVDSPVGQIHVWRYYTGDEELIIAVRNDTVSAVERKKLSPTESAYVRQHYGTAVQITPTSSPLATQSAAAEEAALRRRAGWKRFGVGLMEVLDDAARAYVEVEMARSTGSGLIVSSGGTTVIAGNSGIMTATPAVIESRIDGEFTGWTGETLFKLANGQIWQQASYAYWYHYAYSPKVLIYRSGSGYRLQVDGRTDAIAVTRLK